MEKESKDNVWRVNEPLPLVDPMVLAKPKPGKHSLLKAEDMNSLDPWL